MDPALLAAHQINVLQSLPVSLKGVGYLAVDQEITQIATNAVVIVKVTAVASHKAVDPVATVDLQTAALHAVKAVLAVGKK